jgi:hypothetical protein
MSRRSINRMESCTKNTFSGSVYVKEPRFTFLPLSLFGGKKNNGLPFIDILDTSV